MFDEKDLTNQVIGGCRIENLLGRGGMGSVYHAHHLNLDIPVALKILGSQMASNPDLVQRFILEARAAARLDSQHIVRVLQVGEDQGLYFIQMEFVEGESLSARLKREKTMETGVALQYLYQMAQGLAAAHEAGIIHRDIKPENVLITHKGILKIADFGLAKSLQDTARLTHSGQILGTPHYLPPEQCEGKTCDFRSDIYSLGVTFYSMITGQLPFSGETLTAIVVARLHSDPPSPRSIRPELQEPIAALTLKMMARLPELRHPHAMALKEEIAALLPQYSSQSQPLQSGSVSPLPGAETMVSVSDAVTPTQVSPVKVQRNTNRGLEKTHAASFATPQSQTMRREKPGPPTDTPYRQAPAAEKAAHPVIRRTLAWGIDIAAALLLAFMAWGALKNSCTPEKIDLPEWQEYTKIALEPSSPAIDRFVERHPNSRYSALLRQLQAEERRDVADIPEPDPGRDKRPPVVVEDTETLLKLKERVLQFAAAREYSNMMDCFGGDKRLFVKTMEKLCEEDEGFKQKYRRLLGEEKTAIEELIHKGELREAQRRLEEVLKLPMQKQHQETLEAMLAQCSRSVPGGPLTRDFFFGNHSGGGDWWLDGKGNLCGTTSRRGTNRIKWEIPTAPPWDLHIHFSLEKIGGPFLPVHLGIELALKGRDVKYVIDFSRPDKNEKFKIVVRDDKVSVHSGKRTYRPVVEKLNAPAPGNLLWLELRGGELEVYDIQVCPAND